MDGRKLIGKRGKLLFLFVFAAVISAAFLMQVISAACEQMQAAVNIQLSRETESGGQETWEMGEVQAGIAEGMRTQGPSTDNPFYYSSAYNAFSGGRYAPPQTSGNCTWYAYGRFGEILGRNPGLPTGNAGTWYGECSNYQKGRTPRVGAVVVWGNYGDAGHVAVVEEIKENGNIVTSNSAWDSTYFYMQELTPGSGYTWSGSYYLIGFIYQPEEEEERDQ